MFLDHEDPKKNEWIHNILENKKETELCLFENEHFKLQKDYKFNEGELNTLYLLAHPKDTSLLSIRDLKGENLPLLKSILTNGY